MSVRVYELAKELKMDSSSLMRKLEEMDIHVKSHASTISEEQAREAKNAIRGANPGEVDEQRVKPGVIRRRVKRSPQPSAEEEAPAPPVEKEEEAAVTGPEVEAATTAEPAGKKKKEEKPGAKKRPQRARPEKEAAQKAQKPPEKEKEPARKKKKAAKPKAEETPAVAEKKKTAAGKTAPRTPEQPAATAAGEAARAKGAYIKPQLRRENVDMLQEVSEKAQAAPAETEKVVSLEEEKKKKKKKAARAEEEAVEGMPPVKKGAKKGSTRRREIITRQDIADSPERMYRPGKRKKGPPKKGMKKTSITVPKAQKRIIRISETVQVGELARRMGVKASELLKKLMDSGIMANLNQYLDFEEAALVAADYGYEVENVALEEESMLKEEESRPEDMAPRPPVVTVMGHVDHGKTTLLDAIRKTNVVAGEKGGITQHIGAYTVAIPDGEVTFVDTPGHEAFTAMRARGAQVTDIVVLVVAADDGVMDRTREAISHAADAKVPIIVAVNKIDKPDADPEKVKRQLAEIDLTPEDWGGDTMFVNVSAKEGTGIDDLLKSLVAQAEIMELAANPKASAKGVVIEARMEKGYGPVATVLVREGTLKKGDIIIAGTEWGKVRIMLDHEGGQINEVPPSKAAAVVGLSGLPNAGDKFNAVKDEKLAKQVVEYRVGKKREVEMSKAASPITFDELYERLQAEEIKEVKVILKADVQGSVEAVLDSLEGLGTDKVKVNIIHSGAGTITENDVMLASASGAFILGFGVKADPGARKAAESEGVELRIFNVIYELLDEVRRIMEGEIEPEYVEQVIGHAEVRNVFNISKVGKIAGCYVSDGKVMRNAGVRVLRSGEEVFRGKITGLKRFKDDVKEVAQTNECGISIEGFNDPQEGDVIEVYTMEEVRPSV